MKMKPLIEKIAENLPAKIICLVLAIFIYLIYQFSTLGRKNFAVPLYVQAAGEFVAASAPVKTVRVTVRGDSDEIIQLQESDFSAYLDLSYFSREGTFSIPVQIQLSSHAATFNPLEVQSDPSSVTLKIEPRVVAHIPITPVFTGSPAEGYDLVSFKITPDIAQISGPKSLVAAKSEVPTAAISLNNLTGDFSMQTGLVNRNTLVQIDKPDLVSASVVISPRILTKAFENIPVRLLGLRKNFRTQMPVSGVLVTVMAAEKTFASLAVPVAAVEADCSAITVPGIYEVPLAVELPGGYTLVSIIPEKISLLVESE